MNSPVDCCVPQLLHHVVGFYIFQLNERSTSTDAETVDLRYTRAVKLAVKAVLIVRGNSSSYISRDGDVFLDFLNIQQIDNISVLPSSHLTLSSGKVYS